MKVHAFLFNERGAAAAEMALLVPLLLTLIFGGFEAGHFVWTQHKLTEAVRDGARFAGRFPIDTLCEPGGKLREDAAATDAINKIKLLTRTGQIDNGLTDDGCTGSGGPKPKICGWTQVTVECGDFVGTGIYQDYGAPGYIVKIKGTTAYPSILNGLGIDLLPDDKPLTAISSTPVIGL